jgi:hypothetical protein
MNLLRLYEVMRDARERIRNKVRWTQGTLARDADGESVPPDLPEANCWCGLGAVYAAAALHHLSGEDLDWFFKLNSSGRRFRDNIHFANDFEGHEATLRTFDEPIHTLEKLKKEAGYA